MEDDRRTHVVKVSRTDEQGPISDNSDGLANDGTHSISESNAGMKGALPSRRPAQLTSWKNGWALTASSVDNLFSFVVINLLSIVSSLFCTDQERRYGTYEVTADHPTSERLNILSSALS